MIHVECPWCDHPVEINPELGSIQCDRCDVTVELAPSAESDLLRMAA